MHQVIVDGLEEYLSGNPNGDFRRHLAGCEDCRREVLQFEEVSALFRIFEPAAEPEPAPGFAARVINSVVQRPAFSFWNIFSFDPALFRRVAFASLLLLAGLGGLLVSQESSYSVTNSPERLMVSDQMDDATPSTHRDRMLVTLVSYQP
jgi:anti-sigma factor RsiW